MENPITHLTTHVSRGRLDEIGMGDPAFTVELIDIMIEDGSNRLIKIREALERNNHEEVGKIAHSLKGAALNVGALSLAELCASIDDTVRALSDYVTHEQVSQVENEFNHVKEELLKIRSEIVA